MKNIFFVFLLLIFNFNYVKSTSTSFDQNSIILGKVNTTTKLTNDSIIGLQSLAITGSVGFLGKHLYEAGFFSPLGVFPDNIANLSPLAYKKKKKLSKSSLIKSECNETFFKEIYLHSKFYSQHSIQYDFEISCFSESKNIKRNSFDSLIDRYFEY